jgi:hypothetical protein
LKSGHAVEAERYFRQFLSEGKEITDKQRADANDGLTQAHAKLGRIEVSAPSGTEVTIDGERAGTAPIADLIPVEAGAHTVKFKGPETETDSVTVMGGEKVVARYGRGPGVATTTPSATPLPPAPTTEQAPQPTPISRSSDESGGGPAEPTPPRKERPANVGERRGIWAAPKNPLPSILMWTGTVLAAGGAAYAAVVKGQAQDHADQTAASIIKNTPAGTTIDCNNPPMPFAQACSDYNTDNNDVNVDATVANALIGVSAGLLVGGFLYWWLADKPHKGDLAVDETPAPKPVVVPVFGRGYGALTLTGQF